MSSAQDLINSISLLIDKSKESQTKILKAIVASIDTTNKKCEVTFNNKQYNVAYYGGTPVVGNLVRVFIPEGNLSNAFVMISGENLVSSVNGQTGAVMLDAEDVGARANTWNPNLISYYVDIGGQNIKTYALNTAPVGITFFQSASVLGVPTGFSNVSGKIEKRSSTMIYIEIHCNDGGSANCYYNTSAWTPWNIRGKVYADTSSTSIVAAQSSATTIASITSVPAGNYIATAFAAPSATYSGAQYIMSITGSSESVNQRFYNVLSQGGGSARFSVPITVTTEGATIAFTMYVYSASMTFGYHGLKLYAI